MTTKKQYNWRKSGRAMLAGLLLTGLSVTVAESAPPILPLPDFCASGAADATRTLGVKIDSVQATSNGGAYANKTFCPRWVVDIKVPRTSSPASKYGLKEFHLYGDLAAAYPTTQAACESVEIRATLYKRVSGKFKKIGWEKRKGEWGPGFGGSYGCQASSPLPGSTAFSGLFSPPLLGTDRYRITVAAEVFGMPKAVTAGAWHPQIPW
jgi:hypothetical protein